LKFLKLFITQNLFQLQPIFVDSGNNRHVIVGVISVGRDCNKGIPGINAKIETEKTLGWINHWIISNANYTIEAYEDL
jgi:hypothetical protein